MALVKMQYVSILLVWTPVVISAGYPSISGAVITKVLVAVYI